jgi:ankyrin repeat protein
MSKYGRHILETAALWGAKDIVREIILHSAKNSKYISQTILNESLLLTSDHKIADILLKAGADINAKNEYGETTLVRSVRSLVKNHSMIKLLLNNDANPDLVDNRNKNALAHAIERQDIAAIKILLEKGEDPLVELSNGNNPLLTTMQMRRIDDRYRERIVLNILKKIEYIDDSSIYKIREAALDLPNEEFSSFISVFCDNIEKTTKGNKTIFSH